MHNPYNDTENRISTTSPIGTTVRRTGESAHPVYAQREDTLSIINILLRIDNALLRYHRWRGVAEKPHQCSLMMQIVDMLSVCHNPEPKRHR